jgi:acyl-CoA dehydrogenase
VITKPLSTDLSDTQRELQQLARKFTKEEIIPRAAEYDKTMEYPWEILKKAFSIGILNGFIPEKYGRKYIQYSVEQ